MRLIPPKTSKALEVEYFSYLKAIVSRINNTFDNVVMTTANKKRIDKEIVDSTLTSLEEAFKEFENKINKAFPPQKLRNIAQQTTLQNVRRNKKIWREKLNSNDFAINIAKKLSFPNEQDYIKSRISTNTILITKMKDDYVSQLNTILFSSYQQGLSSKELSKDIQNQFGITKRKAKLIARNETKNTNTQMNNKQAKSLGFTEAVWLGSEDEREREQHNKHNNKEYQIGVGLDDGAGGKEEPGDKINCRCTFYIDVK